MEERISNLSDDEIQSHIDHIENAWEGIPPTHEATIRTELTTDQFISIIAYPILKEEQERRRQKSAKENNR